MIRQSLLGIGVGTLVLGGLVAGVTGQTVIDKRPGQRSDGPTVIEKRPIASDRGRALRRTPVVDVFESCRDAVVNISTTRVRRVQMLGMGSLWDEIFDAPRFREQRIQSVGSGFVVHEAGYIVTNAHVVAQASDVRVLFADKSSEPADVVAVDAQHDLAVLKVEARRPLPYLKLGNSDDLMIGETVIAIGNPLGLEHTVTAGIVSALNRELRFNEDVQYTGLIQTDTAINPGNSGGPLLNVLGELIGINTAIRGDAQNVGFSIPVNELWKLLPRMLDIEHRERVRFGLLVGGDNGEVVKVEAGTPVEKAGLRPGDRIVAFEGEPVRDGIDYYVHLLRKKPGDPVRLTYQRGQVQRTVTIPLESLPPPDGNDLARRMLGMTLREMDHRERRNLGVREDLGLVVDRVSPRGPAGRAGIENADIIVRVDRTPVESLADLGMILEPMQPGQRVLIEGIRVDAREAFAWQAVLRVGGP